MNMFALVACQLDIKWEKEDVDLFMTLTLTFDPIDPKI